MKTDMNARGKHKPSARAVVLATLLALLALLPPPEGDAQSGVLIPSSVKDAPDPALLSLSLMNVDVLIDNQHARVRVLQIFDSHAPQVLEGKYLFDLSPRASVSDFAVWDGDTRVPGVMLERRRADAVYGQIKQQAIDPGLLQQTDGRGGATAFSAKVFPIPARGTKRVELEYTERLPVESLTARFSFPLKPSSGTAQRAGELNLRVRVLSEHPVYAPAFAPGPYAMRVLRSGPHDFEADFHGRDVELTDDLSLSYRLDVAQSALSFVAYRAPEFVSAYDLRDPAAAAPRPDGYFEATALFNERRAAAGDEAREPRNLLLLLDTSLSMRGEKLARAVEAVEHFLHGLAPQDRFNLVLFNKDTDALSPTPLTATPDEIERARAFLRGSALGGATDLRRALSDSLALAAQFPAGERSVVLVSDANPTLGTTDAKKILQVLDGRTGDAPAPRLFAFALGGDADHTLMRELARRTHGHFAEARETEDISVALRLFFERVGAPNVEGVRFDPAEPENFRQVYATDEYGADGSSFSFVGRYREPRPSTAVRVRGAHGAQHLELAREVALPEFDDLHAHLPRLWARARVDALLREMDLNGEREDYINEIIRLSQKYKFVTPYTAFLAAPRALLRPRLIQPGDPVIRVKTDPSVRSVFAVLPFGETLPLRFVAAEGVWEARFLAPAWVPDGAYRCRLLLTDARGNGYQEEKSFVVDSHAPRLKVTVAERSVRAGDELKIHAAADADAARVTAKLYGARPVGLRWSDAERANVGRLRVPAGLASGRYVLTVSAEDFAHNQSSAEVVVEVLGR